VFADLQVIGRRLLEGFAAGAGVGDEGAQVTRGERTLHRSDELHEKVYRSVFGTFSIWRWVYATGPKKKIEYVLTDRAVRSAAWRVLVVLEDWPATALREGDVRRRRGGTGGHSGCGGQCGNGRGDESAAGGVCRAVSPSTAGPARSYGRNVGGGDGRWHECAHASGGTAPRPVGGSGNAPGFDTAGVHRGSIFYRALCARTEGRMERTVS